MAIGLNLKTSRITVATKLALEWSPQQIAGWLRQAYPDDPTMRVSHETIYLSLFVQSRGVLKKALLAHLWQRRTYRRPKVRHSTPAGGAAREARQQNPHVRICGGPGSATTLVYPTAPREGLSCETGLADAFKRTAGEEPGNVPPTWHTICIRQAQQLTSRRPCATSSMLPEAGAP